MNLQINVRVFVLVAASASVLCAGLLARAAESSKPATVAEAVQVIDLSTLPLIPESVAPDQRRPASVYYVASAAVKEVFGFHQKQLVKLGWKELPQSYVSDESSNATFEKNGFKLSLMVFSDGTPKSSQVAVTNHGNLDLGKLPRPAGAKPFYEGPASTMFLTDAAVDETVDAIRKQLLADQWEAYGSAGDQHFFRKNAIRLSAFIGAAPAQDGKTMGTYSAELMSVELPAPEAGDEIQYADTALSFDTKQPPEQVFAFYRKTLDSAGWKPTTDSPVHDDFKDRLIFVDEGKNLLTLEVHEVEGKTRGLLRYETRAEIEALIKAAEEAQMAKKKDGKAENSNAAVSLTLPKDAKNVEAGDDEIKFNVTTGKAKAAAEAVRDDLLKRGWAKVTESLDKEAGSITLSSEAGHILVVYVDVGVLPAEVTINGINARLAVEKKPGQGK